MDDDKLLLEAVPSWMHFIWHLLFFWLVIPLIIAIWKRASLVMRIYSDRVVLETGVLSKNTTEMFCSDIRTVNVHQSLLQRIFGIGNVAIASAATSGYEDVAYGLNDPHGIKEIILKQKRAANS